MHTGSSRHTKPPTALTSGDRIQCSVPLWMHIRPVALNFFHPALNYRSCEHMRATLNFKPLKSQDHVLTGGSLVLVFNMSCKFKGNLIPVCSGTVMCSLQSHLTTALPPLSSCLTIGPSSGSFSILSLTSCKKSQKKSVNFNYHARQMFCSLIFTQKRTTQCNASSLLC